jgi:glycosyltransferase involved in cell wall biosynthesis
MAAIYSSLDVLLSPSAGEGFGIPVLEAQACGVPVIVSDFSAQPELCGSGWLVEGTRNYTPIDSWQFRPDVPDIYDALRQAYAARTDEHAAKAVEFAAQYDVERVLRDYMLPALEDAQERFDERKPVELVA